jgi:hypothetical protein
MKKTPLEQNLNDAARLLVWAADFVPHDKDTMRQLAVTLRRVYPEYFKGEPALVPTKDAVPTPWPGNPVLPLEPDDHVDFPPLDLGPAPKDPPPVDMGDGADETGHQ